jgi:hypothetical protein
MKPENAESGPELLRRNFLKWGGASLLSLPFITKVRLSHAASDGLTGNKNYWSEADGVTYCMQKTVYDGEIIKGYIWARIDGRWKRYRIRSLEQTFWTWHREEMMKSFEQQLADTPYEYRAGGPHSPSVATYGNRRGRGDSDFHINNKIIGLQATPKQDKVKELNDAMLQMIEENAAYKTKVAWLKGINEQDIWRADLQTGIEYFTTPDFETHTFLNLMENPAATLCFQGRYDIFTSFEVRCIAQIVDPRDPRITEDQRQLAQFPAILHGFYHNNVPEVPAVFYWPVEEYDNSAKDKPGQRLVKRIGDTVKHFFA